LETYCETPVYNSFELGFAIPGADDESAQITSNLNYNWKCKTSRHTLSEDGGPQWYEKDFDHSDWESPTQTQVAESNLIKTAENWRRTPESIEPLGCSQTLKFECDVDGSWSGSAGACEIATQFGLMPNPDWLWIRAGTGHGETWWKATLGAFDYLSMAYKSDESADRKYGEYFEIYIDGVAQEDKIYANNCYDGDTTTTTRDYCWITFHTPSTQGEVQIKYVPDAEHPGHIYGLHGHIGAVEKSDCSSSNYVGCYVDHSDRDLDGQHWNRYGESVVADNHQCREYCKDYDYYALQSGYFCSCDNHYSTEDKYAPVDDSECWSEGFTDAQSDPIPSPCMHGENCIGGGWRNAVFTTHGLAHYCVLDLESKLAGSESTVAPLA
jgi:hypothetical protein